MLCTGAAMTPAIALGLTGFDVKRSLQTVSADVAVGRRAELKGMPREGPDSAL
jgi:hypothetical protein